MMRSRELKSGGILAVTTAGEHVDDNGTSTTMLKPFINILTDIWRNFRDTGIITRAEFMNTNHATCSFNLKQLREPFKDQDSAVSQSGLRLVSADVIIKSSVFYNAWRRKKDEEGIDDREEFAKKETSAHKNWGHNTFLTGLSDSRPSQEKKAIVDDVYTAVEERLKRMNPEEFKDSYIYNYVIVRKD